MGSARVAVGAAVVAIVLVEVVAARPAHAWTLAYAAPAQSGCEDEAGFRARAEAQRVGGGEAAELRVEVAAWVDGGGRWHVRVQAPGGAAVRELDGQSCSEVTGAAALIVALWLDGAIAPAAAPAAAAARPRPRPAPARDPEPTILSGGRADTPVWLALSLAGGVDAGTLPRAAPGVRAELALGYRWASLVLGVARWAEVEVGYEADKGMRARAWQGHVGARVRVWRGLEVGGAFEIGLIDAEAIGVDEINPRTIGWQGAGGGLAWRGPLWGDLDFALEFEVLRPFVRPTFRVDGEVRFQPDLCARGWAGLSWHFL